MATYLQFAVLGLGLAAMYIGVGGGLLLVYRATGIINFAQGAMAMWGAYVYAQVRTDGQLILPVGSIDLGDPLGLLPGMAVGLVTAVLVGLLSHLLVFRPVRKASTLAQVVTSVGLMLTLQALVVIRFGPNNTPVPSAIPSRNVELAGAPISLAELGMVGVMLALTAGLGAYFRYTQAGVATRAAAENEQAAVLMGFSPNRLAAIALTLASVLSTVSVMIAAPLTDLNPSSITLLVVPALAVLLVARMKSLPVVCVAAVVLGAFQSVLTYLTVQPFWPRWAASGLEDVIPFIVVMIILFAFGDRLPSRGSLQTMGLPNVEVPRIRPTTVAALVAVAIVLLSVTDGSVRFGLTTSLILALLALSFVVITGYLGQISLAQSAFAGAAGFVLSKVTTNLGWPFPVAILACALVAALLGLLVALPAFRIRGAQLAIVTLAAALAIQRFVFGNYTLTPEGGNPIAAPSLFGVDFSVRAGRDLARLPFSLLVLGIVVALTLLVVRIVSGDTGRAFLAVRANERAAASAGINVRVTKLIGFALSAFIAGVAGCLIGYSRGQLSAESFTVFVGLQVLAVTFLGGITRIGGAIIAGVIAPLGIIYVVLHSLVDMGNYYALISGLALVITAILHPEGIASEGARIRRLLRRHRSPQRAEALDRLTSQTPEVDETEVTAHAH